jgi:hypothetical protein
MIPPAPEQSQASEVARAGTEREPPTSSAMSLSATAAIHAEPNAIVIVQSATLATTQDDRVSIEDGTGCCIILNFRPPPFCTSPRAKPLPRAQASQTAAMRQNAPGGYSRKFPSRFAISNEIDRMALKCKLFLLLRRF